MPDRRVPAWRGPALAAVAVALVALIVALGVLNPPRQDGVSTDRLGPDQGEQVAEYLARARDSLAGSDADQHWALVSFTEPVAPEQIPAHSSGMRIAEVLYRITLLRVQTPLVAVPVPEGIGAAVDSAQYAAWLLPRPTNDRAARIVAVSAERLRAGCACVVGLVVRGPLAELRNLAARNGIRAVQALPADAVAGSFAVVPLLPEYRDVVLPGPDDGPVPAP
ncbi:hypothetical protein OHA40_05405 [Nocardia sp. NBC_00508]|uniref:hypothetical protein n=1 Tax=Nocardia sp. NBC_00508 TaxID=2975992 RepID=UPI002E803EB8|nr:hypothetical protein [Nocardia sp. NBC_00508]WUD67576.1 hypothetical protein OHA40_05405 [Nocardia sp. NBC_00508]